MNEKQKCGYVAIIGRPNVGKSTLLNTILGKKISIISPKPQTTRNQILGIKTIDDDQIVFIDTPGLHKTEKSAMNRYMNRLANAVIVDADIIVFVVEAGEWYSEDQWILDKIKEASGKVILAINKIDTLKDKALVLPYIEEIKTKFDFADVVPFSALKKDNVIALEKVIISFLPDNAHFFPDDQVTDKSERFQVAEIIREKVIQMTEQEVPYSTTVQIETFKEREDSAKKLIDIDAVIWVEREGQKPIVIGAGGERLKKIGSMARRDIERLVGQKVFLRLWVKVKEDWTDSEKSIKALGLE